MTIGSSDVSEAEVFEVTSGWMTLRTADMNFAIDSLKEGNVDSWYVEDSQKEGVIQAVSLIDPSRIGLIGHSMGGATAVTCGRRDDISAAVDLDGTMLGENLGINGDEVFINEEPYHTPLLNFQNQEHHDQAVEAERTGNVDNGVMIDTLNGLVLRFFDCYLKGEGSFSVNEYY